MELDKFGGGWGKGFFLTNHESLIISFSVLPRHSGLKMRYEFSVFYLH